MDSRNVLKVDIVKSVLAWRVCAIDWLVFIECTCNYEMAHNFHAKNRQCDLNQSGSNWFQSIYSYDIKEGNFFLYCECFILWRAVLFYQA